MLLTAVALWAPCTPSTPHPPTHHSHTAHRPALHTPLTVIKQPLEPWGVPCPALSCPVSRVTAAPAALRPTVPSSIMSLAGTKGDQEARKAARDTVGTSAPTSSRKANISTC